MMRTSLKAALVDHMGEAFQSLHEMRPVRSDVFEDPFFSPPSSDILTQALASPREDTHGQQQRKVLSHDPASSRWLQAAAEQQSNDDAFGFGDPFASALTVH